MLCFFYLFADAKQTKKNDDFRFRPAIGGQQNGWFDAKGLPTAIKINDRWVLQRGGTMEWLIARGYVPDAEREGVMIPNPFDNRYTPPRIRRGVSLVTTASDFFSTGISPRVKTNDPFDGLLLPFTRPGSGPSPVPPGQKVELGPVLDPEEKLPTLEGDNPFAPDAPEPAPNINRPKPVPDLPEQDPFVDELDNPINPPRPPGGKLNELPGKPIEIVPKNDNPFIPVKPNF